MPDTPVLKTVNSIKNIKKIIHQKNDTKSSFSSINDLFGEYCVKENKGYISQEFQDYGYRLALDLDDLEHKSLYIKMAKNERLQV